MNAEPETITTARFGEPAYVVRLHGGRVMHAITELRQLGWTVRLTQVGRNDVDTVSAGSAGTTLCGVAFGYGSQRSRFEIGEDAERGRCGRCEAAASE